MRNTMNAIACCLTVLLCLVATACQERPAIDFDRVEALMDPHPDSALALLDTLHAEPQHYTAKDRARYYLLLTEAKDKCFLTHTTDTLIRFSAEYYEQHNDRHHYAKALYLQGRIYEDWRENEQSAACWVKALDYGKDSEDHYLLYRIAYRLATLYAYQDIADRAMDLYKETLRYAIKTQDSGLIALGHSYIGRVYGMKQDWANASIWYEKGLAISREAQCKNDHQAVLQEYIGICSDNRLYAKVDSFIMVLDADPEFERDAPYYLCVGDYYRLRKDTARAVPFLLQALTMRGNIYTKKVASQSLSYLYDSFGQPQLALHYDDLYHSYVDSIRAKEVSKRFSAEVDYQSEQNQAERGHLWMLVCCVSALLVLSGCVYGLLWKWQRKRHQTSLENSQLAIERIAEEKEREREENRRLQKDKEAIASQLTTTRKITKQVLREQEETLAVASPLADAIRAHTHNQHLSEEDWRKLYAVLNKNDHAFEKCLRMQYASFEEEDVRLCCLIRMGVEDNAELSCLFSIGTESIKKRKQRLRERMGFMKNTFKRGEFGQHVRSMSLNLPSD